MIIIIGNKVVSFYVYHVCPWEQKLYNIQNSDMQVKGEGIKDNDQARLPEKHMFVGKMTTNLMPWTW